VRSGVLIFGVVVVVVWWCCCPQFYPSACSNAVSSLAVFSVEGGEEARSEAAGGCGREGRGTQARNASKHT